MKKIVYIVSQDPKDRCELVSSVFAQALTALSFGYECSLFALDRGIRLLQPEYIAGLKAETFDPLAVMLEYYQEMGGKIYGCNAAMASRGMKAEDCVAGVDDYVNAAPLIETALEADAVFTY